MGYKDDARSRLVFGIGGYLCPSRRCLAEKGFFYEGFVDQRASLFARVDTWAHPRVVRDQPASL